MKAVEGTLANMPDASKEVRSRGRRQVGKGLTWVSPWIAGALIFTLYPFVMTLYYSFTKFSVVNEPTWVGGKNYAGLVTDDLFWKSLWNTAYYTIFEVPLSTIVALALAMLLNMRVKGLALYRTAFYLPSIVPVVATAVLWLWLFNPSFGVINIGLGAAHLPQPGWMFDEVTSKPTFILMGVWAVGGPMIIYLAALQGVPAEMYEAADLEGANAWQRLRYVTLPMISPAVLFNVILSAVDCLQYFTQAYMMTNGGPNDSTLFYALYLYRQAFTFLDFGKASAMAWVLFVLVLAVTAVLFRSSSKWVYYGNSN
jgi:multiple sugar transport system permease protein